MAAADGAADMFLDRSIAKQCGFEVPRIFEHDLFRKPAPLSGHDLGMVRQ
jgi:hypothetical protein